MNEPGDPALGAKLASLLESYERITGSPLCTLAELWEAPFVVLAHGTEQPPVLFYGNRRALELWKTDFATLTRLPSRETAEPVEREARERFMAEVRDKGIVRDYEGVRIARDGSRFRIHEATVWNITDGSGALLGQAACFSRVTPV